MVTTPDAMTEEGDPDSKPSATQPTAAREEDRWQTLTRAKPLAYSGLRNELLGSCENLQVLLSH
jgi:hypothetical protein